MPLVRMIVSARPNQTSEATDAIVNTLYFNVSGSVDEPDYDDLVNDLWALWSPNTWSLGQFLDIRAYNMSDAEPRPVKARKAEQTPGTMPNGPRQIALCLSYYADRNLPRRRGRIYIGPWATPPRRTTNAITPLIDLGQALADLGGLNVDWSIWSPTTSEHHRISTIWVDDSWDVIRSRKDPSTSRTVREING